MRLTKLVNKDSYLDKYCWDNGADEVDITNKLGQLEDIEDELGIDLMTLFEAMRKGCFVKETFCFMGRFQTQIIFTKFVYLYYAVDVGGYLVYIRTKDYYFKDYGKTWALTKEELK